MLLFDSSAICLFSGALRHGEGAAVPRDHDRVQGEHFFQARSRGFMIIAHLRSDSSCSQREPQPLSNVCRAARLSFGARSQATARRAGDVNPRRGER
ncbi:MAG: hypothetical protein AB7K09_24780 [Planctomycetota bacterium]